MVGGSWPGIASTPLAPCVNSVERTVKAEPSGCSAPPTSICAVVPGANSSVCVRVPEPSVIVLRLDRGDVRAAGVDPRRARVVGDQHERVDLGVVLPRDVDDALRGDVALALEDERQRSAAVDREVVAAVGLRRGAAVLRVVEHRDADAADGAAHAVRRRSRAARPRASRRSCRPRRPSGSGSRPCRGTTVAVSSEVALVRIERRRDRHGLRGGRVGRAGRGRRGGDHDRLDARRGRAASVPGAAGCGAGAAGAGAGAGGRGRA